MSPISRGPSSFQPSIIYSISRAINKKKTPKLHKEIEKETPKLQIKKGSPNKKRKNNGRNERNEITKNANQKKLLASKLLTLRIAFESQHAAAAAVQLHAAAFHPGFTLPTRSLRRRTTSRRRRCLESAVGSLRRAPELLVERGQEEDLSVASPEGSLERCRIRCVEG